MNCHPELVEGWSWFDELTMTLIFSYFIVPDPGLRWLAGGVENEF